MKNLVWLVVVAGLVSFGGCAEQKPEEAARRIVDQQIAIHHEGFELDTSRVSYAVVEREGDNALVAVSGNIAVKATIPLVKEDGEWVLRRPAPADTPETKAAH